MRLGGAPDRQAGNVFIRSGIKCTTQRIAGRTRFPVAAGGGFFVRWCPAGTSGRAADFAQGGYLVLHSLLELPAAERRPQDGIGLVAKQTGMPGTRSGSGRRQHQPLLWHRWPEPLNKLARGDVQHRSVDYDDVGVELAACIPRVASAGVMPGFEGAQVLQMGDDPAPDGIIAMQYKDLYLGQLGLI